MRTYNKLAAITPSDTVNLPLGPPKAIYVGGAGVVALVFIKGDGEEVVNLTAIAGAFLPIENVKRINSTNTTATALLACYSV